MRAWPILDIFFSPYPHEFGSAQYSAFEAVLTVEYVSAKFNAEDRFHLLAARVKNGNIEELLFLTEKEKEPP